MQQSVSSWLQSSKGAYVQQDWVQACVEWIEQEEGGNLPISIVKEMVYEQWLHADLREVASQPCIPISVVDQQNTQINGMFTVQVNSVINVGVPAYGQLQKLKGHSIDSIENSGNKRNFELKPTRLLLMLLTDGLTDFQAMEYRPIPQLNNDITPGTKLLLQGGIDCRLGTLLLTGDHVQVLGGGVESLVNVNQQKRVLARALNDESLADEGEGSSATGTTNEAVTSNVETNQHSRSGHHQQGQNEQNQMEGVEMIEDLDLENFDDFEEVDSGLQGDQEQWSEDINFSPQDLPVEGEHLPREEEEIANTFVADTSPGSPVARTVGQKWRPPSNPEGPHESMPLDSTNLPGMSGLNAGKRSKVSQSVGDYYEPPEPLAPHSTTLRTTAVASVRPTSAGAQSGSVSASGVPVVLNLQQANDHWVDNPLITVKAHFVRVTGKLKPCNGKWTVAVIIEDDCGGQLDVELSNHVLEKLIGFTAQEFVECIQPNKSDPVVKARGSKGFKRCQVGLVSLNCFMEIRKQSTFGAHPVVERLLDCNIYSSTDS